MNRYLVVGVLAMVAFAGVASATHTWGNYHWAQTESPFTLKLGDNVAAGWDGYLGGAAFDWSASRVLDLAVVAGSTDPKNCRPVKGRVEVCNSKYGKNGWLGIAQIWVTGTHIRQGVVKLNDTYFNTKTYNTPAWRRFVMCQEVGHPLGLDHQDEGFSNPNLGTCMDYTSNPAGPPSNEHPNAHDYEMLETIYAHLDATTTIGAAAPEPGQMSRRGLSNDDLDEPAAWGNVLRRDGAGRPSLYGRDLAPGYAVFTFVTWVE